MRSWCPSVYLSVHLGIRPLTSQWASFLSFLFRNRLHVPACTHIGASITLCNPVPSGIPVSHHYPLLTTFGILPRFKDVISMSSISQLPWGEAEAHKAFIPFPRLYGGVGQGKQSSENPLDMGFLEKPYQPYPFSRLYLLLMLLLLVQTDDFQSPQLLQTFGNIWRHIQ